MTTYQLSTEKGHTYTALRDKPVYGEKANALRPVEYQEGKGKSGARAASEGGVLGDRDKIKWEAGPAAAPGDWALVGRGPGGVGKPDPKAAPPVQFGLFAAEAEAKPDPAEELHGTTSLLGKPLILDPMDPAFDEAVGDRIQELEYAAREGKLTPTQRREWRRVLVTRARLDRGVPHVHGAG